VTARQSAGRLTIGAIFALLLLPQMSSATPTHTEQTAATRIVAEAFLRQLFGQQDLLGAYDRYAAPDFIQHNPEMADGIAGRKAYFAARAKHATGNPASPANVYNMVLVDGDLFAIHHHIFSGPEDPGRVFVDIWRVADGRIVEHWDVIQPNPEQLAHSNGSGCGRGETYDTARVLGSTPDAPTCGLPDPAASRVKTREVIERYVAEVASGDVRNAILRWFSADYRQHSPTIAEGAQGAIAHLQREYGKNAPPPRLGPARVIAEGDLILYHRLVTYPGAQGPSANVDIFRVTNGKISEHWDVKQAAPAKPANANSMW